MLVVEVVHEERGSTRTSTHIAEFLRHGAFGGRRLISSFSNFVGRADWAHQLLTHLAAHKLLFRLLETIHNAQFFAIRLVGFLIERCLPREFLGRKFIEDAAFTIRHEFLSLLQCLVNFGEGVVLGIQ